jgi:hypothetical protein
MTLIQHARHLTGIAGAEIIEVHVRDQCAGNVGLIAPHIQHVIFQRRQAARFQSAAPHAAGGRQQIEVRSSKAAGEQSGQREARREQRQIEAAPVEGHDRFTLIQRLRQVQQHRGFFVGRAQEVLAHRKRIIFIERADADEKSQRARAARETGGLRIDEGRAA